jgi:hypothetical protein
MTKTLKPVTLDILITKITAKTVYYKLYADDQEEYWRIPDKSNFDKAQLVVGRRYRITSQAVTALVWDHRQRKRIKKERFDWTSATEIGQKVTLQARSAKQRQASEALTSKPLADNGTLFTW